jgi:hypothetical protein
MPIDHPTSNEVTDATIVGEANSVLWKRAIKSKDELLIGAAHVLNSVWIMLRMRDKRAYETMANLTRLSVAHRTDHARESLDGLQAPIDRNELEQLIFRDRATIEELPSKGGLDRHLNVASLYFLTDHLWRIPVAQEPSITAAPAAPIAEENLIGAARIFVVGVQIQFPDLAKVRIDDIEKCATKVANAWQRRARLLRERNTRRKRTNGIDTALLVVDGLKAIGLPHNDANNWIRSVLQAITKETKSAKREQERGTQGRFGSNRIAPKARTGQANRRKADGTSK